jgi:hypothetical protein
LFRKTHAGLALVLFAASLAACASPGVSTIPSKSAAAAPTPNSGRESSCVIAYGRAADAMHPMTCSTQLPDPTPDPNATPPLIGTVNAGCGLMCPPAGWGNCVIGCTSGYPGEPICGKRYNCGGSPCNYDDGCDVATQGKADPGKPCIGGSGNSSHAVGDALDGNPDVKPSPGNTGGSNEVSDIFRIQATVGNVSDDIAFAYHTFNNENFIQPLTAPGAPPITIRMGNGQLMTSVSQLKNYIHSEGPFTSWNSFVNQFLLNANPRLTSYNCFDGPWVPATTAQG